MATFLSFPAEIIKKIGDYLDPISLSYLCETCDDLWTILYPGLVETKFNWMSESCISLIRTGNMYAVRHHAWVTYEVEATDPMGRLMRIYYLSVAIGTDNLPAARMLGISFESSTIRQVVDMEAKNILGYLISDSSLIKSKYKKIFIQHCVSSGKIEFLKQFLHTEADYRYAFDQACRTNTYLIINYLGKVRGIKPVFKNIKKAAKYRRVLTLEYLESYLDEETEDITIVKIQELHDQISRDGTDGFSLLKHQSTLAGLLRVIDTLRYIDSEPDEN